MDPARPLARPGPAGGLGYPAAVPTCLVTGGAGFLGSHLCDELIARGHRVICVDNLETGSLANIEHIRDRDRFMHLGLDIIDPYFIEEPVDFVYHLASPASPIDYLRLPLHTLKVGSYGTHHTLGLAKHKRARFLLASTSEVYGDPEVHPQQETYWGHVNPIGPRGVYDEAKRYVDDLIRGMIALAESGAHQPVNIGNPDEFTLLDLAEAVVAVTESRSEIV